MLSISTTKFLIAELAVADYNFHRWTSKPTEYYSVNSKPTCKPPELHTIMKKCNGTGMVLKICETKNNVWKRHILSIQNSIDNHIKTTRIKPNFASLNRRYILTKPVFMGFVGIFCWLYGSISGQLYSEKYISGHRKKFCDCVSGISMKNGLAKVYLAVFARMSSVLYIISI